MIEQKSNPIKMKNEQLFIEPPPQRINSGTNNEIFLQNAKEETKFECFHFFRNSNKIEKQLYVIKNIEFSYSVGENSICLRIISCRLFGITSMCSNQVKAFDDCLRETFFWQVICIVICIKESFNILVRRILTTAFVHLPYRCLET